MNSINIIMTGNEFIKILCVIIYYHNSEWYYFNCDIILISMYLCCTGREYQFNHNKKKSGYRAVTFALNFSLVKYEKKVSQTIAMTNYHQIG